MVYCKIQSLQKNLKESSFYLDNLEVPSRMVDQGNGIHLVLDGHLQLLVGSTVQLDAWEQITDETQEQGLVLINLICGRENNNG